jgi:hypothetical protein
VYTSKEVSNTPEGVLVRLKDKLCIVTGLDPQKIKLLVDKFVVTTFQGVANSKTHFAKVNIYNELTKNKMTIKVFFKFLRIINIKSVRISVTVRTVRDNEFTVHEDINIFTTDQTDED